MATDLPALSKASNPQMKGAFEAAVEAAIDGAKSDLVVELQAIVASASDFTEFQSAVAAWAPYEG